jgi:hypothetical protein
MRLLILQHGKRRIVTKYCNRRVQSQRLDFCLVSLSCLPLLRNANVKFVKLQRIGCFARFFCRATKDSLLLPCFPMDFRGYAGYLCL